MLCLFIFLFDYNKYYMKKENVIKNLSLVSPKKKFFGGIGWFIFYSFIFLWSWIFSIINFPVYAVEKKSFPIATLANTIDENNQAIDCQGWVLSSHQQQTPISGSKWGLFKKVSFPKIKKYKTQILGSRWSFSRKFSFPKIYPSLPQSRECYGIFFIDKKTSRVTFVSDKTAAYIPTIAHPITLMAEKDDPKPKKSTLLKKMIMSILTANDNGAEEDDPKPKKTTLLRKRVMGTLVATGTVFVMWHLWNYYFRPTMPEVFYEKIGTRTEINRVNPEHADYFQDGLTYYLNTPPMRGRIRHKIQYILENSEIFLQTLRNFYFHPIPFYYDQPVGQRRIPGFNELQIALDPVLMPIMQNSSFDFSGPLDLNVLLSFYLTIAEENFHLERFFKKLAFAFWCVDWANPE
uniref:Uncharacterized protein n=1 Tax=Boodleopsis pusilla TaxID=381415 RepID=A0A386AZE7_9CHLO|nr:hypothetical protein [Boodleopsis pusilla]AYC64816.1 hypothetical protein [Boodleopsis pusilla]